MNLTWQKSESLVAPLALDTTLSKKAVYIRKNIEVVPIEDQNGETVNKYVYDETTITPEEYKELGDNTAKVLYELALDTPVEYVNGHIYKPSYIYDYKGQIDDIKAPLELIAVAGGDISAVMPDLLTKTVYIYDATRKFENREAMNIIELSHLYYFLFFKKEELYNAYREALETVL